jgi:hypothetical protein
MYNVSKILFGTKEILFVCLNSVVFIYVLRWMFLRSWIYRRSNIHSTWYWYWRWVLVWSIHWWINGIPPW